MFSYHIASLKCKSHSPIVKGSMVEKESGNKTLNNIELGMAWTDLKLPSHKSIREKKMCEV